MCANANNNMRILLCCLEDTDTEPFALIFGHKKFLKNTKHPVSENEVLSRNSSGNRIGNLKNITVTEIVSEISP